jgi:hypothetical protein
MITRAMKAALRARGYTDADIRQMTPAEAHAHCKDWRAPWDDDRS